MPRPTYTVDQVDPGPGVVLVTSRRLLIGQRSYPLERVKSLAFNPPITGMVDWEVVVGLDTGPDKFLYPFGKRPPMNGDWSAVVARGIEVKYPRALRP